MRLTSGETLLSKADAAAKMYQRLVGYSVHEEPERIDFVKVIEITNFKKQLHVINIRNDFVNENRCLFEWRINPSYSGYVSVLLRRSLYANYLYRSKISCTISVVDVNGKPRFLQSFGHHEGNRILYFDFGLHHYVSKRLLLENDDELLPNDTLTLMCEVSCNIFALSKEDIFKSNRKRAGSEVLKKYFVYNLKTWVEHCLPVDSNMVKKHNSYAICNLRKDIFNEFWKSTFCSCLGECPCGKALIDTNVKKIILHCYLEFLRLTMKIHDAVSWEVVFQNLYNKDSMTKYALNNLFNFDFPFHNFKDYVTYSLLKLPLQIRNEIIHSLLENTVFLNAHSTWLMGLFMKDKLILKYCERLWEKAGERFIDDIQDVYILYEHSVKEDDLDLKHECLRCLRMFLTVDTVEGTFHFAMKQNDMGLLSDVAKFIFENESEVLISGERDMEKWFLDRCDFTYGYVPTMEEDSLLNNYLQFYQ